MSTLKRTLQHSLLAGALCATLWTSSALAQGRGLVPLVPGVAQGLIVFPEQRFDPLVQRLMAERSLRALPIYGGQLLYLVPVVTDRREEAMQIRYLEALLRERSQQEAEDADGALAADDEE